jgi:hypothetical protein
MSRHVELIYHPLECSVVLIPQIGQPSHVNSQHNGKVPQHELPLYTHPLVPALNTCQVPPADPPHSATKDVCRLTKVEASDITPLTLDPGSEVFCSQRLEWGEGGRSGRRPPRPFPVLAVISLLSGHWLQDGRERVARRSRESCEKVARGREKVAKTEASRDAKKERAKERRTSERASRILVISEQSVMSFGSSTSKYKSVDAVDARPP